jgi:hypothetical protein
LAGPELFPNAPDATVERTGRADDANGQLEFGWHLERHPRFTDFVCPDFAAS